MKTNKVFFAILLIGGYFTFSHFALAQVPQAISYQASARDGSGNILVNKSITARITIQTGSTGTAEYKETFSVTTNAYGLFSLQIGRGTPVAPFNTSSFAAISWAGGNKWIKTEVDPAGGSNYIDLGTSEFLSVPYVLNASSSNSIPSMTTSQRDALSSPANGFMIYNLDCNIFQYYDGTVWINLNKHPNNLKNPGNITGLSTPNTGQNGVSYSIPTVLGANTYTWSVPTGSTIASGQGTNSINVNFGSANGSICVIPMNSCDSSTKICIGIYIKGSLNTPTAYSPNNINDYSAISANWSTVSNAVNYLYQVSTNSNFTSFVSGYSNKSAYGRTYDTIWNLQCNTTYYYRVRATNSYDTSAYSNVISFTTLSLPATPTVQSAYDIKATQFTTRWYYSQDNYEKSIVYTFRLDVSTSSTFSSFVSGYNNANVGSPYMYYGSFENVVTGLSSQTTYYYRVRSVNQCSTSGNSNTISVTTQ